MTFQSRQRFAVLRWLRRSPQHSVPAAMLAFYLGVWTLAPHHRPQLMSLPPVPVSIAAAPAPSLSLPDGRIYHRADTMRLREGRDRWQIEAWEDEIHYPTHFE